MHLLERDEQVCDLAAISRPLRTCMHLTCRLLGRYVQSLEHLAEADLAYLEMVRTKAGMSHHSTAGAQPLSHLTA